MKSDEPIAAESFREETWMCSEPTITRAHDALLSKGLEPEVATGG